MDSIKTPMPYDNDPNHGFSQNDSSDRFMREPANPYSGSTPLRSYQNNEPVESENLVQGAAPLGGRGASPPRQPTLPNFENYAGYQGSRR